MATVTVPSINTGDEITSTTLNTFITSVNALSGAVSASNMDDEAIDRRNLRKNVLDVAFDQNTGSFSFSGGAPVSISELRQINHIRGQKLHICCSFQFYERTTVTNPFYNQSVSAVFEFYIERKKSSTGSYSAVGTKYRFTSNLRGRRGEDLSSTSGITDNGRMPMSKCFTIDVMENFSKFDDNYDYRFMAKAYLEDLSFQQRPKSLNVGSDLVHPGAFISSYSFFVVRYPE